MIALKRIRTVQAINYKLRGAEKRERDKELMLAQRDYLHDSNKKIKFKSTYWKPAKKQLKTESNGKCAYCEADIHIVAHGDVEHFRPKDIYWWLAYTYDNYLYACQICNQTYKGNNFPVDGTLLPVPAITVATTDLEIEQLAGNISPDPIDVNLNLTLQSYLHHDQAELPHLINPYFNDPAIYFAYHADDTKKEVLVVPSKPQYDKHIKAAEKFYGINRIELKNFRYEVFTIFRSFAVAYSNLNDEVVKQEIKKQLDNMRSDKYIFAGMNNFFNDKF
jgi:hypothetical protein